MYVVKHKKEELYLNKDTKQLRDLDKCSTFLSETGAKRSLTQFIRMWRYKKGAAPQMEQFEIKPVELVVVE